MAVRTIFLVLLAMACIATAGYFAYFKGYNTMPTRAQGQISKVVFGDTSIAVEVADTEASREQGLSGRTGLNPDSGMLFIFGSPSLPGFWMKDMQFSLDMIFMDQNGAVVTIAKDATPESYQQQPPQVFYPAKPVVYVLEVPAGYAAARGISVGSQAVFK